MSKPYQRRLRRLAAEVRPEPSRSLTVETAAVTDVVPSGAADGVHDLVTVDLAGGTVAVYLDSYLNPAVGDVVQVLVNNNAPIIQGRVVGSPVAP